MTSTLKGITLKGSAELVAEFFCKYLYWYLFICFFIRSLRVLLTRSANMLQRLCSVAF